MNLPHFGAVTIFDEDHEPHRFELRLSEPPVLSTIASFDGRMESATLSDGDYHIVVHVSPNTDVSSIIQAIQEGYPESTLVAQRHTTRADRSPASLESAVMEELTERQRTAIELAYFAGFFEWPRVSSGEDIAESMGVSAPTFHQHARKAQRKVFQALFDPEHGSR